MKLKYYLRGIGIGIIVTTVILMIAFAVHREQPLTDDEIKARATELGMVMPEDLPTSDKLSDTDVSAQPDNTQEETEDAQDGEPETPEADGIAKEETDEQTDPAASGEKEEKPETEVIEQAEISIVGGEYSDAVCKKLKKAGIIEDADDFNKYLAEGGFDNLIQPGNYVIPLGADYDMIVKIITEKKR